MWQLILLCSVILFAAIEKMSFMPLKVSLAWVIFWGLTAYFATILFSGLSRQEAYAMLNTANISTLEFIELMIMFLYIFSKGTVRKILGYYPGLMTMAPVCVISFLLVGSFPGMNFKLTGIVTGCIVSLVLAGLILLQRHLATDANVLYKTVIVAALVNIIIYGLL